VAQDQVERLLKVIEAELPRGEWVPWPGGYPGEAEAALVDAVFSIGARYGTSPDRGVRGVVKKWREHRDHAPLDDLCQLKEFAGRGDDLAEILGNQQKVARGTRLKADALAEAAERLVDAKVRSSADVAASQEQKKAYTSVRGLGPVTWEYFLMLLGIPGVKADVHIQRFVSRAVDVDVSPAECRSLLHDVAEQMGESPTELDHAVWAYERSRDED
jgi:hypothetical protein